MTEESAVAMKKTTSVTKTEYAVMDHIAIEWNSLMDVEPNPRRRAYQTSQWTWGDLDEDGQLRAARSMLRSLTNEGRRAEIMCRIVTEWTPLHEAR